MLTAWIVLGCALATTGVAWRHAVNEVRMRTRAQLDRYVERFTDALQRRIADQETVLLAAAAMLDGRDDMNGADWRRFVEQLDLPNRHPRVRTLQVVLRVPAEQLPRHVEEARAEGLAEYTVHPPGTRDEYFPIVFAASADPSGEVLGLDIMSEPTWRAAAERARDTGETTIAEDETAGMGGEVPRLTFVLFQPSYVTLPTSPTVADRRRSLVGFAVESISLRDVFGNLVPPRSGMRVAL